MLSLSSLQLVSSRSVRAILGLALLASLTGCESGQEAAAVGSAKATRDADNRVAISAELACVVLWGQPRASGCDVDGQDQCVRADFFDANDSARTNPRFTARHCQNVPSVQGAKIVFRTDEPIPAAPPMTIVVQTELALEARDQRPDAVTVASP